MATIDTDEPPDGPPRHGMQTRKKRWNAHPALAEMELELKTTKRRSSAQVKADNLAKAQASADAEADLQERIAKVARIEEEVAKEDTVSP